MKKIMILLLTSFSFTFAQVDTTDWYPLEIGNKWLFRYGWPDVYYSTVEVISDTLMPNGKTYFVLNSGLFSEYQRKENNEYVFGYNVADSTEFVIFDFVSEDRSFWENYDSVLCWGIVSTGYTYNPFLKTNTGKKSFDYVMVDTLSNPIDTIFGAVLGAWPVEIFQGVGITSFGSDPHDLFAGGLFGAIINGDTLGTITSIKPDEYFVDNYYLYQNYPNPFNPSTTIKYSIPRSTEFYSVPQTTLKVYDLLGNEIATLVNEEQKAGNYEVNFNAKKLSSGVYFYKLQSGTFTQSKKMILLK